MSGKKKEQFSFLMVNQTLGFNFLFPKKQKKVNKLENNWFPHYLHMLRAARRLVPK
jgi:hypothetical protein